jgi:dTMP kinase
MATGKFITFEGGEGSGKSTQVAVLRDTLERARLSVLVTREPGGTPYAEELRSFLLTGAGRANPGTALAEALLFYSARADHIERRISPALARGTWVVCDRFADSTRAYQGAAGGVGREDLGALERVVLRDVKPDLTFILDLPAEVGLQRAAARRAPATTGQGADALRDLFEGRDLHFHQRLRQGFIEIAAAEPERCVLLDAQRSVAEIGDDIIRTIVSRLGPI